MHPMPHPWPLVGSQMCESLMVMSANLDMTYSDSSYPHRESWILLAMPSGWWDAIIELIQGLSQRPLLLLNKAISSTLLMFLQGQIASQLLLMSLSQQLRSICWSASINWWPWLMPQQSWACPRTEQRSIHCAQQQEKLYRKKKHGKEVKSKFMSNHGDPFEAMSTWVSFIIHGKPLPQYHNKPLELYEILQSQQKEPGEVSSSGIRALSSTYQTITLCWRMGLWHCWFWRRHWELFIVHVVHVHWQGIHHVWSRWSRN